MGKYRYEDIKKAAKEVRAKMIKKGIFIKKKIRKKPRDNEKIELLYIKTLNILKKYKPKKIDGKIFLPFFKL